MTALVIHAPARRKSDNPIKFEDIRRTGKAPGYGLTAKMTQIPPGTQVILLRKDINKRRAEGVLVTLKPTGRSTRSGRWRYDIYVADWKDVDYKPEALDRFGVNLI